ncbi:MAG: phosphoribosyltransferase family protein [Campylobacterota bacterium]|nr:phosphoribosyltransferase family protein [Campylobacterota bacterium]
MCESFSLSHICKNCQKEHLTPKLTTRKILNSITVYSFYSYRDIESLLLSKHTDLGFYMYQILGEIAFKKFADHFSFEEKIVSIAVDDHVRHGYSHTALLNKSLTCKHIKPRFNLLRAQNAETYSGKTFQYRMEHPRDFTCKDFKEEYVILVDDIITTGLTLSQAVNALHVKGKEVLFCLTLADAKVKD